jgi:hypothetical protein
MQLLQQRHVLGINAVLVVFRRLGNMMATVNGLDIEGLHAIHYLALGQPVHALPLPLLLLLGVPVDVLGFVSKHPYHGWDKGLFEEVGPYATALAMSFHMCLKWTKQEQQQRLGVIKGLVAAGASYKAACQHGTTLLSMAAALNDSHFLQALLARRNALAEFSRKEVQAAFLMAASHNMWINGCLLLEAGAKSYSRAAAAKLVGWAVQKRKLDALKRLLAAGATPNARALGSDNMPLHELVLQADAKGSNMVSCWTLCSWHMQCWDTTLLPYTCSQQDAHASCSLHMFWHRAAFFVLTCTELGRACPPVVPLSFLPLRCTQPIASVRYVKCQ